MEGNPRGGKDVELVCKTLQVGHKLFYFDLKENPRDRYLKISEKTSASRYFTSTLVRIEGGVFSRYCPQIVLSILLGVVPCVCL
ncbi:Adenylosuccinate synthetase 1, chloroplastic [Dionaea muscipula]